MKFGLFALICLSLIGCSNPFDGYSGYWLKENSSYLDAVLIEKQENQFMYYELRESTNFEPTGNFAVLKSEGEQLAIGGFLGNVILGLSDDGKTLLLNNQTYKKISLDQLEDEKRLFEQQEKERAKTLELEQEKRKKVRQKEILQQKKETEQRIAQAKQDAEEQKKKNIRCSKITDSHYKIENELRNRRYNESNIEEINKNKQHHLKLLAESNCSMLL